jgi:hypothetical protein
MWSLKAFMLLMGVWKVRGREREGVVWCPHGFECFFLVFMGGVWDGGWMDAFVAFDERTYYDID